MTLAIVLAAGTPAAGLTTATGESLADRLAAQVRRAGADEVRFAADLDELAALVDTATAPVLITGTDLVAHTAVLRHLATSPVGPTVALVLGDPPVAGRSAVREERGQVVDAGAVDALDGDATGVFGGALRVGVDDLPTLAAAARAAGGPGPAVDRLFAGLAALGTLIFAQRVRLLVAHRVEDASGLAAAEAAVTAVDEDRAELRLSVKEKDDFFTTYFVSTWSPQVVPVGGPAPAHPDRRDGDLGALRGGRGGAVRGRRATRAGRRCGAALPRLRAGLRGRPTGPLHPALQRLRRLAGHHGRPGQGIPGLRRSAASGPSHAGLGNGWALAIAAMTLQTVRHMTDTWYGALHDEAARRPRTATGAGGGIGARLSAASTRVQADTGSVPTG